MGEHRTAQSTHAIDAIARLAESLGYNVRREWPIPGTGPRPEQIDIALFIDDRASSPAFAIEIDSADVPASTSNAVKIFGKLTSSLVKPFFVFHIFLLPSRDGNRRRNTETLFSTQNYRTYDFSQILERQVFIEDLIRRHRAIRAKVDLYQFGIALDEAEWNGVDRYAILETAERELDSYDENLRDIAALSIEAKSLEAALSRLACSPRIHNMRSLYLSFTGRMFSWPLLFGLRAHVSSDSDKAAIFREFREWQEEPAEVIFHPSYSCLGLAQEFDFAICEVAPLVFTVVAMLFGFGTSEAAKLCEQLFARAISEGRLSSNWRCYALAWCVIASIKVRSISTAEKALAEIQRCGGVPSGIFPYLSSPTFYEDQPSKWAALMSASDAKTTPSIDDIATALDSLPPCEMTLQLLVARLLVEDDFLEIANEPIIQMRVSAATL
jgi:hypothetical protein